MRTGAVFGTVGGAVGSVVEFKAEADNMIGAGGALAVAAAGALSAASAGGVMVAVVGMAGAGAGSTVREVLLVVMGFSIVFSGAGVFTMTSDATGEVRAWAGAMGMFSTGAGGDADGTGGAGTIGAITCTASASAMPVVVWSKGSLATDVRSIAPWLHGDGPN